MTKRQTNPGLIKPDAAHPDAAHPNPTNPVPTNPNPTAHDTRTAPGLNTDSGPSSNPSLASGRDFVSEHELASGLRMVTTRLVKKLRNKSTANEKLSLTERSTLWLLDQQGELLPTELAAMEKITTQSMSQILNHLSALGYITRRISETDKRKSIISLSEAGLRILYKVRNERDEWLNKALQQTCSPEEQQLLRRALVPLTRLVDFE